MPTRRLNSPPAPLGMSRASYARLSTASWVVILIAELSGLTSDFDDADSKGAYLPSADRIKSMCELFRLNDTPEMHIRRLLPADGNCFRKNNAEFFDDDVREPRHEWIVDRHRR